MKTILRKTLSLFLAFAMLAAALPAITPAAEAADTSRTYNLATVKTKNESGVATAWYAPSELTEYDDAAGRYWAYFGDDITEVNGAKFNPGKIMAALTTKAGEYFAIKIKVPQVGTYSASLYNYYRKDQGVVNYHFIPMSKYNAAEGNLAELISGGGYIVNSINTYNDSNGKYMNGDVIGNVPLSETEYIFAMEAEDGQYMRFLSMTLDFVSSELIEKPIVLTYDWKFNTKGGVLNSGWASGDYAEYAEDGSRYWNFVGHNISYSGNPTSPGYLAMICYAQNVNEYAALEINVPEAGEYSTTFNISPDATGGLMNLYIIPSNAATKGNVSAYILEKYKVASNIDCYKSGASRTTIEKGWSGSINFDTAGDYLLVMEAAGKSPVEGSQRLYFTPSSMIIKKTGEAAAAETQDVSGADILGEYYAYVNDGVLNLYGGVKKLAGYTKVGFEIKTADGDWTAISEGTNSVYSTLKGADGRSVGVTAFGDDCKYVFADSTETAVSGEISVRAYAVPVEGDTVYGYVYTVTIE